MNFLHKRRPFSLTKNSTRRFCSLILAFVLPFYPVLSQSFYTTLKSDIEPRIRVMIDNDFGGDPDGLCQLAHHLLSPSVDIRGVIGTHFYKGGFYGAPGTPVYACEQVNALLKVMSLTKAPPVFMGADSSLSDLKTPVFSEGARAIVQEAMREDTKMPLYVVCGAGLTTIASAYLMEPRIAAKVRLVWIGGGEYWGQATPPPGYSAMEYNLGIDLKAGQVIFNISDIPIWQVPRNAYREALVSYAEMSYRLKNAGETGAFLFDRVSGIMLRRNTSLGETYVLGDSPLVLLTALQSGWEADPSSSGYVLVQAPKINDVGQYLTNHGGRNIRVYNHLDIRLMMEDFYAKLALYSKPQFKGK